MSTYIFGAFYTILFVLLCKMFLEIFEAKRETQNRIRHEMLLVGLMGSIYGITIILANYFLWKEVLILVCAIVFKKTI